MIILISLIKPHHFIFLIIGILVYEKEFIKYAVISTLIVVFIYFLELIFFGKFVNMDYIKSEKNRARQRHTPKTKIDLLCVRFIYDI